MQKNTRKMILLCVLVGLLGCGCSSFAENCTPMVVGLETPEYPHIMRAAKIQGDAEFKVSINVKGEIVAIAQLKSHVSNENQKSETTLAQFALQNLKTWRFRADCASQFNVRFEFRLRNPPQPDANTTITLKLPGLVRVVVNCPVLT